MAYYLRKENKKKGTYLQMYESHWDKEKKQPRSKVSWLLAMYTSSSLMRSRTLSLITQTLLQRKTKSALPHSQRIPVRVPLLPLWNITLDIFFCIHF